MSHGSQGSALLVVVLLSAAFLLYASSMFWVNALMRQGVEQQIKAEKINAYADGLADYALALFLQGRLDAKNKKEIFLPSLPAGASKGYSGTIAVSEKSEDIHIMVELVKNDKIVQHIEYNVSKNESGNKIYDFQRTSGFLA